MGEESCSVETNFAFLLFFCLLVFKGYRMGAFEIIGLESGCCEEKSARNTNLVGELKNIGTASLLEECEKLTSLKLELLDPPELRDCFCFFTGRVVKNWNRLPRKVVESLDLALSSVDRVVVS